MTKPTPEAKTPRQPRGKKSQSEQVQELQDSVHAKATDKPAKDEGDLKPIADALKPLAMDALAAKQRARPEDVKPGDPLNPTIMRGDNVDMVNNFKTSTKDQLHKLARRYESKKKDLQGHAGDISTMLTKAEETQHLDTWCFKEAMKWDRMSADKLVRRLPIFMKYLTDLEVVKKATAQGDLLAEVKKEEGGEQTDLEQAAVAATAAATGLAPGRKPSGLSIVPKPDADAAAADTKH